MKTFFLTFFLALSAHAKHIEDVQFVDMKYEKSNVVVRLHLKESRPGDFFIVQIGKDDEKALEKIALVLKEAREKEKFKLSLDIPSFSPQSGSFYRSNYVTFIGSAEGSTLLGE